MSPAPSTDADGLLALYDEALPHVYGYLLARCGTRQLAEDLTAETFLAAVDAARRPQPTPLSQAWLIGTARHKLADHWRTQARDSRGLQAIAAQAETDPSLGHHDPLDALLARATLDHLAPQYRCALVLRYVDDLPVPQVAAIMRRSLHATESVLVRARAAFRSAYPATEISSAPDDEVDHG